MDQLLPLLYLFFFLVTGMLAGRSRFFPRGKIMQVFLSAALYALLFFMGFRLGRNPEISGNMASIGLLSLSYAVCTVAGTAVFLVALFAGTGRGKRPENGRERSDASSAEILTWHHFRGPVRLFATVAAGFLVGLVRSVAPELTGEDLSTVLLYFLLFLIGVELSRSGINVRKVLAHPDTLILPAGTVLGSLAGGLVLSFALGVSPGKSLALASGFGWYSLSGVIITNLGDPVLGSAGFIANMIRETMALLSIPLIERSCGPSAVPVSIASGAILSLLVPVLVPLFFRMG